MYRYDVVAKYLAGEIANWRCERFYDGVVSDSVTYLQMFYFQFQIFDFMHARWLILVARQQERYNKHQNSKTKSKPTSLRNPSYRIVRKLYCSDGFCFL